MSVGAGSKIILTDNWCYDGFNVIKKGTRGVIVKVLAGVISGDSYEVSFDGQNKNVVMDNGQFNKFATIL